MAHRLVAPSAFLVFLALSAVARADPPVFQNPIVRQRADPWVFLPCTIAGTAVRLTQPELPWERRGYWLNEGPAVLEKNGRVFLTYSASATDASYCMGMLTAAAAGIFGPGYNSFTTDKGYDTLVYHARSYRDITGDPLYDPNRDTRAQAIAWNQDGTPRFDPP
jgi:GH43 family beta-xylosidase